MSHDDIDPEGFTSGGPGRTCGSYGGHVEPGQFAPDCPVHSERGGREVSESFTTADLVTMRAIEEDMTLEPSQFDKLAVIFKGYDDQREAGK